MPPAMQFTYTPSTGLCAIQDGRPLPVANFRAVVQQVYHTEHLVKLLLTNHKGDHADLMVQLDELERPRTMKNRLMARGNFYWIGPEKLMMTYLRQALERHAE